ncbi:MAG: phosphorylase [Methylococcus sp.]|nr:phosphorylase [Methylococcus sp.]
MTRLGLVVALPAECRTLTRQRLHRGEVHALSDSLSVCLSGSGAANAEKASHRLAKEGCTALVSWGCAGALSSHLASGDLVLPSEIACPDGSILPIASDWQRRAVRHAETLRCRLSTGRLAASAGVIHSHDAKRALAGSTGAEAVDMESGAVARTAASLGLPVLVVRTIADHAELTIPRSVLDALDPYGDTRLLRLMGNLALRPGELPDLIRLALAFKAASATLRAMSPHLHAPGNS